MFGQDHMTSSRMYRDLLKGSLRPYRIHSTLHLGLSYECSPLNMLQDLKTKAVEFRLRESWLTKRKNHLQAIRCWSNPYPWNLLTKVWDNGPSCSTFERWGFSGSGKSSFSGITSWPCKLMCAIPCSNENCTTKLRQLRRSSTQQFLPGYPKWDWLLFLAGFHRSTPSGKTTSRHLWNQ